MKDVESCASYVYEVDSRREEREYFDVLNENFVRVPNEDYFSE